VPNQAINACRAGTDADVSPLVFGLLAMVRRFIGFGLRVRRYREQQDGAKRRRDK